MDRLIDHGLQLSPATDWSLIIPEDWLARLPLDGDRLTRPIDSSRAGHYTSPVYRGFEVVPQPITKPVLILADATGQSRSGLSGKRWI